ncbi:hypothetical protein OG205_32190 [Lentzea sp. NBC_00516]|uniref:hypothetical protein n=1 Tax=Lentzea sp. NBC_00516 TaxID=2903582 RepID=UPI002E816670|nr:hypothetical protein [Lentzea sp. NBC_00516]WUD22712.1 hypothetical protein OG205_32190 [Lentzea sp. NBC_00516]
MDELDDQLRKLFSDDRLDVHSPPVAVETVVRGATRLRRRRAAITGAFAVAVLVGAGAGLAQLGKGRSDDTVSAYLTTATPTSSTSTPQTSVSTFTSTVVVTTNPPPNSNGANPDTPSTPGRSDQKSDPPPPPPTPEAQPGRYGSLSLGMSEGDALATGSLVEPSTPADPENRCRAYATKSVPDSNAVIISPARGIARITLASFAKTPKNVGVGSKVTDVKAAYANATQSGSNVVVSMNATPAWSYIFESDGATVTTVFMRLNANDCAAV